MLTRRALIAAPAAVAATGVLTRHGLAATPPKIVVMAKQIDDIITLDPHESFEYTAPEICGNCYQRLVLTDPRNAGVLQGDLAERWEISDDGLTFTFHLRQGPTFASGKPVTAGDAAFSLIRAVSMNKAPAFIITQFGFDKDNAAERIRATNPATLMLTIAERRAPSFVLNCLTATVGSVVEKALVMDNEEEGDWGSGWLKATSAGSGPYAVTQWRASERIVLEANPHHESAPKTPRVVIQHVAEPSAQLLMLRQGDTDIARNPLAELGSVEGKADISITSAARSSLLYLSLNQKNPNLAKPQVRQALKWAIDYQAMATNLTPGRWTVHQSFLPSGFPGALEGGNTFHQNLAKAKALLAEAGLADGFEASLDHSSVSPYSDIAQAIQADLARIGIKLNLLAGEQRQVITKTRARLYDIALVAWGSDYFDPNSNAEAFNVNADNSDKSTNRTLAWRASWQDKGLSDRALAAVMQTNPGARIAAYEQMQRDAQERSPFVILMQETEFAAVRAGVTGFVLGATPDRTDYAAVKKV
jgi:peptide/nickel transport system substrate-binding protein